MSKGRKNIIISVVVGVILISAASRLYDHFYVSSELKQSKQRIASSITSSITYDAARQLLENDGYRVIYWWPEMSGGYIGYQESQGEVPGGGDAHYKVVLGERKLLEGRMLNKPLWIHLTIRFTMDDKFHDVTAKTFPKQVSSPQL